MKSIQMRLRGGRLFAGIVALATLAWFAAPAISQKKPGDSPHPSATGTAPAPSAVLQKLNMIHVQSNLVDAHVVVKNQSGNYVQDLSASDFVVLDDGVPQHITRFSLAMQPVALVIVVQTSDSVGPLLQEVQPLGSVFANMLVGVQGQTAVLSFAGKSHLLQNFTSNAKALESTLQHLDTTGSGDRLNDALARAILMLSERPSKERRIIVVISEGLDRGSETSQAEIIRAATSAGISIYGLRFEPINVFLKNKPQYAPPNPIDINMARPGLPGQPHTPSSTEEYSNPPGTGNVIPLISDAINAARSTAHLNRGVVRTYAEYTGGVSLGSWTKGGFDSKLQEIALDVNSQYMLSYVPSTLNQHGFHRIEISVRQPDLSVRTRAGYFYLPQTVKK